MILFQDIMTLCHERYEEFFRSILFPMTQQLLVGPHNRRGFTITLKTHNTRQDSSGRVMSPTQRPLPDNTQHTDIHAPGGIRTRNPSKRAVADPRLRSRGYWDRPSCSIQNSN